MKREECVSVSRGEFNKVKKALEKCEKNIAIILQEYKTYKKDYRKQGKY